MRLIILIFLFTTPAIAQPALEQGHSTILEKYERWIVAQDSNSVIIDMRHVRTHVFFENGISVSQRVYPADTGAFNTIRQNLNDKCDRVLNSNSPESLRWLCLEVDETGMDYKRMKSVVWVQDYVGYFLYRKW